MILSLKKRLRARTKRMKTRKMRKKRTNHALTKTNRTLIALKCEEITSRKKLIWQLRLLRVLRNKIRCLKEIKS